MNQHSFSLCYIIEKYYIKLVILGIRGEKKISFINTFRLQFFFFMSWWSFWGTEVGLLEIIPGQRPSPMRKIVLFSYIPLCIFDSEFVSLFCFMALCLCHQKFKSRHQILAFIKNIKLSQSWLLAFLPNKILLLELIPFVYLNS